VARISTDPWLLLAAGVRLEPTLIFADAVRQWGGLRRLRLDGIVDGADRVLRVLGESQLGGCLEELHAEQCWVRRHWNNMLEDAAPEAPPLPPRAEVLPRLLLALPQLRRVRALSLRLTDPCDGVATAQMAPRELERMAAPMRWREEWQCDEEEEVDQVQGGEAPAVAGPPVVRIALAFQAHGVDPAFARALMARHPGLVLVLS
jgi:hypothetical protein